MITYRLPCDWEISTPDDWQGEYDKKSGQCVFYPQNSDLTIRITPFHAEKDGIPAPAEVMENAYRNTIPASAMERDANSYPLNGFAAKMYQYAWMENHSAVHVISVGYYAAGELLSVSIWGTSKAACENCLDLLQTLRFKR